MTNVPLGKMRRMQHHVLPLVHPTFARRLAGVAIRAPYLALRSPRGSSTKPNHLNDPVLRVIDATFGIDPRHTLAEIVKLNTGVTLQPNVFKFAG
jgi:hypothetical protein